MPFSSVPSTSQWPRETTLQKKILDYLAEGHRWRGGQMFILMDDIDNFRDGTYLD